MTTIAKDPAVMETDYLVLHERIGRLIHLARGKGATEDELRAAVQGPLHPDRVNLPAAGRFPPIDPAPYLALAGEDARFRLGWDQCDGPLCGAQITEEASDQIRQSTSGWSGITTCILPASHVRGWGHGSAPFHDGILIRDGDDPSWPTVWRWQGAVRELGQVALR